MYNLRSSLLVVCFSSLVTIFCSSCEEPKQPEFGEGDLGMDVEQTADGGFLVVGETKSRGAGGSDAWLIKTDNLGNLEWSATYGGTDDDWAYDLDLLPDGGAIIVGTTMSSGAGETDVWLFRVDDDGTLLWEQTFGGISYDHGFHVEQDYDGGFILSAETYSFGAGENDGWLIKTDQLGTVIWEKTYGTGGRERAYWVAALRDSNYIVAGYTDTLSASEPASDLLIFKVDQAGTVLWEKPYIVGNSAVGRSVVETTDGGYVVAGFFQSYYGDDIWFLKTDTDGQLLWDQVFTGGADDRAAAVALTDDGGYIIVGASQSYGHGLNDCFLIKTDDQGEIEWNHFYGGASYDIGRAVQQTREGNYIVAGTSQSIGPGDGEVWLLLAAGDNEQLWSKTFGDASDDL
ncbi:hypothetical protein ACFL6E_03405 [Candidatus Neomarinimicrobiota bacterium]